MQEIISTEETTPVSYPSAVELFRFIWVGARFLHLNVKSGSWDGALNGSWVGALAGS